MKYNWNVVLQSNNAQKRNYRGNVKANSISEVIANIRNLLNSYSIKSIIRKPLS